MLRLVTPWISDATAGQREDVRLDDATSKEQPASQPGAEHSVAEPSSITTTSTTASPVGVPLRRSNRTRRPPERYQASNYDRGKKRSRIRGRDAEVASAAPTGHDGEPERLHQWAQNIKRGDKTLDDACVVCERHFEPSFIERTFSIVIQGKLEEIPRDVPLLAKEALPTVFPGIPSTFPSLCLRREKSATYASRLLVLDRHQQKRSIVMPMLLRAIMWS
ncbi:hypothetical protein HPB50_022786 [Hyalomma asiaticum]|uniref:Uncharacterized protein n=1 Tax=Hyalomma asiaticum TaxID=266040 RepID=A0ACB7RKE3_HYAAI|nr:hypothetical protein HPB50_022786 [Hyalomma asiaticum]